MDNNLPKIRFKWLGVSYLVSLHANTADTEILLPNGTYLRAALWQKTSPPVPVKLCEVPKAELTGNSWYAYPADVDVADGIRFELLRQDTVLEPSLESGSPVYPARIGENLSVRVTNLPPDRNILLEIIRAKGDESAKWVRDRKNVDTLTNCARVYSNSPRKHILRVSQQIGVLGSKIQSEPIKTFEFVLQAAR